MNTLWIYLFLAIWGCFGCIAFGHFNERKKEMIFSNANYNDKNIKRLRTMIIVLCCGPIVTGIHIICYIICCIYTLIMIPSVYLYEQGELFCNKVVNWEAGMNIYGHKPYKKPNLLTKRRDDYRELARYILSPWHCNSDEIDSLTNKIYDLDTTEEIYANFIEWACKYVLDVHPCKLECTKRELKEVKKAIKKSKIVAK